MGPEWANVVVSALAILASGGIAILVPYLLRRADERSKNRARLSLVTTRSPPSGLHVVVVYEPEFRHEAVIAKLTLKTSGVTLNATRWASNSAPISGVYGSRVAYGPFVGNSGVIRLSERQSGSSLDGAFLLLPSTDAPTIIQQVAGRVEILTLSGRLLLKDDVSLSPIDEDQPVMWGVA